MNYSPKNLPITCALALIEQQGADDASAELLAALKDGELTASGYVSGIWKDIPRDWWHHLMLFRPNIPFEDDVAWFDLADTKPPRPHATGIVVPKADIERLWPSRVSATASEILVESASSDDRSTAERSERTDVSAPYKPFKNRTGPRSVKKDGAIEAMIAAVDSGKFTLEALRKLKEKELDTIYPNARRTTLREARDEAVKQLSARQNSDKTPTNDK
jgi:hypothetical protein